MIYLDSWVFLELLSKGEKINSVVEIFKAASKEGFAFSTIGLFEIKYRLMQLKDHTEVHQAMALIESLPSLHVVPVFGVVSKLAADLRYKYYNKTRQLSIADTIHLATAIKSGCSTLYTGDPDFRDIAEIKTVII